LKKSLLLLTVVAIALGVWLSAPASADKPQTHQGLTAFQWSKKFHTERAHTNTRINHYGDLVRRLRKQLHEKLMSVGTHPLERSMLCIHSFEGAWNDPNPPYWGGMQMDRSFYRTYGRIFEKEWGTPDHWPVSVQITVAITAYLSGRGFYPWPNTARYCHLIS